MLTTIILGTCISVQGELVGRMPNGDLLVRTGTKVHRGRPIQPKGEALVPPSAAA